MLKRHYPALFFLVYVIGWQWYIFHHIYPDRWYESFGHAMFSVVIAFSFIAMGGVIFYLKKQMKSKRCIIYISCIELIFIIISFRMLYFGSVDEFVEKGNFIYLLFVAIFIFILSRQSIYRSMEPIFNGEIYEVDIVDELKLIRNGVFDDLKACVSITFMLIIFLLMMLYFKLRSL